MSGLNRRKGSPNFIHATCCCLSIVNEKKEKYTLTETGYHSFRGRDKVRAQKTARASRMPCTRITKRNPFKNVVTASIYSHLFVGANPILDEHGVFVHARFSVS